MTDTFIYPNGIDAEIGWAKQASERYGLPNLNSLPPRPRGANA